MTAPAPPALRTAPGAVTNARSAVHGSPLWLVRVNPLRRARLAAPELRVAVASLVTAELATARCAEQCSQVLFDGAGASGDDGARSVLVALRRAVRHDRALPAAGPVPPPPQVLAVLASLVQAREHRRACRQQVEVAALTGLPEERQALARLLADGQLRAALALVAPEVADAADRYRTAVAGGSPLPARLAKSERGLLQYVSRALLRTSPLSRLTAVGLAQVSEAGVDLSAVDPRGAVAFTTLDRPMLHYVLGGLRPPPPADVRDCWVQLPPTAEVDEVAGRLHFLSRPTPSALGEESSVRRLAAPLAGVVEVLVSATAMGPRQRSQVVGALVSRAGLDEAAARAAVDGAVGVGMLCIALGPDAAVLDVATALSDSRLGAPALRASVLSSLPRVRSASPEERRSELTGLQGTLERLSHAARRPAAVIVQEDCVLPPLQVSTAAWRRQLDDLSAVVGLLSAFDRLHDVRALLAVGFVERFGTGGEVSLVEHAGGLIGDLLSRTLPTAGGGAPVGPADGSLHRLDDLRRQVWAQVRADLGRADAHGEDVQWSAELARAAVADLPERFRREPLTYGVLVQTTDDRLVVNDAYAGHGMLFGRFLDADASLGGQALPLLAERLHAVYGADGCRLVEDASLHRLNVNAHPPVLDQLQPEDWAGLRLVHDRETDALSLRDPDGRPLRVLNLGAGHPDLLPAPLRLAVWLVCGGRLMEDLVGDWFGTTGWDGRRTRRTPRLSVGRVVTARRRWYGGQELADAVAAGPGPGERLVALTAWRARHGVPEEVVLTDGPDYAYTAAPRDADPQPARRRKPQHVDLASALTARVLPRVTERRRAGYLEGAMPAVVEGPHAQEWVVPVGHRGRGATAFGWDATA